MAKIVYPLARLIEIKKKRVEDAEKIVKQKQEKVAEEKRKLAECEVERDKALKHEKDKLDQLRHELDNLTTSPKIIQMKFYLKVVKERVISEEKKVQAQKGKVEAALRELDEAKEILKVKRREVDKLETHRKDWMKQMRRIIEVQEENETNELGAITYQRVLRERKKLLS